MTFFTIRNFTLDNKALATDLDFRYVSDVELVGGSLILGDNIFNSNITMKYPGDHGGGGLYQNVSNLELIGFDTDGNAYLNGTLQQDKILTEQILIADDGSTTFGDCLLELRAIDQGCILLHADTDNIGEVSPYIAMTQDGGFGGYELSGDNSNRLRFIAGSDVGSSSGKFSFYTARNNSGGGNASPVWVSVSELFAIDNVGNFSYRDLNMDDNDINSVGTIDTDLIGSNTNSYTRSINPFSTIGLEFREATTPVVEDGTAIGSIYADETDLFFYDGTASSLLTTRRVSGTISNSSSYSSTSTTYTAITDTLTITPEAGDYKVSWTFNMTNADGIEGVYYQIEVDIDGAGASSLFEGTSGSLRNAADPLVASGFTILNVPLGGLSYVFGISYRTSTQGTSATVENINMEVYRIS